MDLHELAVETAEKQTTSEAETFEKAMRRIVPAELKPCPFCGSNKIKIDSKSVRAGYNGVNDIVYRVIYSARCNKCHARGGAIGGKVLSLENYPRDIKYPLPVWATTWEKIKSKAIEAWNRRATDEPSD